MAGKKGEERPVSLARVPRRPIDLYYMSLAMEEAEEAFHQGEVPVGCLLVDGKGNILKRAHNQMKASSHALAHAELLTLDWANRHYGRYLEGMTLYVSLEPCLMCTGAMVHAHLGRLVFGAYDSKQGAVASNFQALDQPGLLFHPRWEGGLMAEQGKGLMQDFFRQRRKEELANKVKGGRRGDENRIF